MQTITFPVTPAHQVFDRLSEDELNLMLSELFNKIDVPFRRSENVPKTIFIDFFGTPNSGKTTITSEVERFFRRSKFNTFCPPETAEIYEVRTKTGPNPLVSQAQHLVGVEDYVLNLAYHPRLHVAIISRGLIDMLFWYERGVRHNEYSDSHRISIRAKVYELLKEKLVDSFVFFTCSVEEAIKREYAKALTQKRGSKMNEQFLGEAYDCYRAVLEDLKENVPGLPIFHIDTTGLDVKEVTQDVARCLLPTLNERWGVSMDKLSLKSYSLLKKKVAKVDHFEEQLKLKGKRRLNEIEDAGWRFIKSTYQIDTYLNPNPSEKFNCGGEVIRVREEDGKFKFMYKGEIRDKIFSNRIPYSRDIAKEEAKDILTQYPEVLRLAKSRDHYQLGGSNGEHFFTLHVDRFDQGGVFSEIRARGSINDNHDQELMNLASQLGFSPENFIIGKNYLALALEGKLTK